jgi:hypothetical protein
MKLGMNMKFLGFGSMLALAGALMATQAQATDITYTTTTTVGAGTYKLDMTTNGALGALSWGDFKAVTLTTTFNGVTTSAVAGDLGVYLQYNSNPFTATATALQFNYANADALFNFGSSITGSSICVGGANYGCAFGSSGLGFTNGIDSARQAVSGLSTFASVAGAVPEASTWAMMVLGVGMVAGIMRSKRRNLVAA